MSEEAAIEDIVEMRSGISRVFEEIIEQQRTVSGVNVSPETALQSSAVLACVRVLSESVAALPLSVFRRLSEGGKQVASDLPLHRILSEQPNDWMTSFEFRELLTSHILLWGSAYAEIRPGRLGAVTQLHPLHPSRMKVERLENGRLRYIYQEPGKTSTKTFRQEQIFHLRWLTQDGVNGYVPTTLSRDAIGLARATELQASAFFGNGAKPGVVLTSDQPLKPETAQRLRRSWEDMHKGANQTGKTAVLPHGIQVKELGATNEANQLLETRRYQVEDIARAFRVPVYMIGDLTKSSYSSVEQQGLDFVTFSLVPHLKRWESAIRRDLILDDDQYFAEFDVKGLMRGDNAGRAQFYRELWNLGCLSINEIREAEGMNPIEQGEKRFVQVNMALLESFVVQDDSEEEETKEPEAESPATEEEETVEVPTEVEPEPNEEKSEDERSAPELMFRQTLRKLAATEADGILERRNKPAKLSAWLEAHEIKMRNELCDSAKATGRHIGDFVESWMNETRDLLLECKRSGKNFEEATNTWTARIEKTLKGA